VALM